VSIPAQQDFSIDLFKEKSKYVQCLIYTYVAIIIADIPFLIKLFLDISLTVLINASVHWKH